MKYFIDLFSPETYEAFSKTNKSISGFRPKQTNIAKTIHKGDIFVCYITKISRFAGILEVQSDFFIDDKPIFYKSDDPFIVRFSVKPIIWQSLENSLPIYDSKIWNGLSFTGPGKAWTSTVRGSLRELKKEDAELIHDFLKKIDPKGVSYPLSEDDLKKIKSHKVRTQDSKEKSVSVPENDINPPEEIQELTRDSIKIQSLLAEIGERMNFNIWIPRSDRNRVMEIWHPKVRNTLLELLPLNYDDTTLKTIENIDVLWVKRRSIVRAFEVEHTTSIYSGILRMADLMALQPNLDIKAHIVAPDDRREKVLQEISRPVFTLLEKGPLNESCTYISYNSIIELAKDKRLEYMNDSVIDSIEEFEI
jgi:hypothetical protein